MKKIRQIGTIILTVLVFMTFIVVPIQVSADGKEWDGKTITQPSKLTLVDGVYYYEISTPEELAYISITGGDWCEYNYILKADIVLNDKELTYDENGNLTIDEDSLNVWKPLELSGNFDGNGHTVSGVYVNLYSEYSGFFSGVSGTIKNLTVSNSYIKSGSDSGEWGDMVGGLCGILTGKIYKSYFYGAVVSVGTAGGLCAVSEDSSVNNCGNYGDVWGTGSVGGIIGDSLNCNVYECFNEGNVMGTEYGAGGIVGSTSFYSSRFNDCINRGAITGNTNVGGICGYFYNGSNITTCGNTGKITGKKQVGGICGSMLYADYNGSSVISSYNSGTVTGDSFVGGITGYTKAGNVNKSYNIGNVTGMSNCGALIGKSESIWGKAKVSNCCYLKNDSTNAPLNGFGNAEDAVGVVEAKNRDFFCINSDNTLNIGGHTEEIIPGKVPTCTETGITEGKKCSVCGEILVAQEEIPALGHKEEKISGKTATCTETGLTEGKKCSVCNEILVAQSEIPTLGHTEEVIPGKSSTCTEKGLTEGKKCSVCNEILVAQSEIPTLGHTEEVISGKSATCTGKGLTEGKKCSSCGEILVAQKEIAAKGHTPGSWEVSKKAEIGKEGKEVKKCTVCKAVVDERAIAALKEEGKPGDVDGNGKITAADARLALRISAKLEKATEYQTRIADMDKNNKITAADARKILRISAKLE